MLKCWDTEMLELRATPLKIAGFQLRFKKIKDGEDEKIKSGEDKKIRG